MRYPDITPYDTGFLKRGEHSLYYEKNGNPNGLPVVVLHGGPGSGTSPWQRQMFNPEKYNIILFDQRGCGKSVPHASLSNNTTPHLVSDIHALKIHLGFEKWHVFGGSWGSTLALAYADKFADEILSLTMYGIFLCRERELFDLYFDGGIVSHVFPEVFTEYLELLPKEDKANPIIGYDKLFKHENEKLRHKAIELWTKLEKRVSRLIVTDDDLNAEMSNPEYVLSHSIIENHYFMNNGFIDGDAIIKNIGLKVKHIAVNLIQGRYDMVCPFATAYELHKSIPHSALHIIPDAGHSANEKGTTAAIIKILDEI